MNRHILLTLLLLFFRVFLVEGQSSGRLFDHSVFRIESQTMINSIGSDIGPILVHDSLYFSGVQDRYLGKPSLLRNNKAFYGMYKCSLDSSGTVSSGRVLLNGFGSKYHEGPSSYCPSTGELFVTVSSIDSKDRIQRMFSIEAIRLSIVIKKFIDGKWTTVGRFPYNDKKSHVAHPAISLTGDTLIFSADYSSSTLGGSDLYMSIRRNGQWSEPVNLGSTVNTHGNEMFPSFLGFGLLSFSSDSRSGGLGGLDLWYLNLSNKQEVIWAGDVLNSGYDDFGLTINRLGTVGYFSSNRGNVLNDDIYKVSISKLPRKVRIFVYEGSSNVPLSGVDVSLVRCSGEKVVTHTTNLGGNLTVDVNYSDCLNYASSKSGYLSLSGSLGSGDTLNLRMSKLSESRVYVLDAKRSFGIDGATVICQGMSLGTTTGGGFLLLPRSFTQGCELQVSASGYLSQNYEYEIGSQVGLRTDTIRLYKKELGEKFVLNNINYDYNKWDILPESTKELDKLVGLLLSNPALRVELGSHTDSRGKDSYNQQLSQKRSTSAVSYILSKGISSSRITAKGYGESQLLNSCGNGSKCSEQEHRENRRTEFKIISF